eukprot:3635681-Rhodomonas_salina.1
MRLGRWHKIRLLRLLAGKLQHQHGLRTHAILRARVPIITVEPRARAHGLSVDISIQPRDNFGRLTVSVLQ